jgi:hypothetical protein
MIKKRPPRQVPRPGTKKANRKVEPLHVCEVPVDADIVIKCDPGGRQIMFSPVRSCSRRRRRNYCLRLFLSSSSERPLSEVSVLASSSPSSSEGPWRVSSKTGSSLTSNLVLKSRSWLAYPVLLDLRRGLANVKFSSTISSPAEPLLMSGQKQFHDHE